jgi:hypothetical protein
MSKPSSPMDVHTSVLWPPVRNACTTRSCSCCVSPLLVPRPWYPSTHAARAVRLCMRKVEESGPGEREGEGACLADKGHGPNGGGRGTHMAHNLLHRVAVV